MIYFYYLFIYFCSYCQCVLTYDKNNHHHCYDRLLRVNKYITQHGDMRGHTNVSKSLWGVSLWFNIHEDRQGAYYSCCGSPLYQLSSWLIFSLCKSIILRCPLFNSYRCRKWIRRHEFKSWTDCILHSTNTLGKGMNPIILPPAMGK